MAIINKGDVLGDCPECNSSNAVIYRGNSEAVCKECGLVCDVELEGGELDSTQPDTDVAEAAPQQLVESAPQQLVAPASHPAPKAETLAPHVPKPVDPYVPPHSATEAPTSFATPPVQQKPDVAFGTYEAQHAPPNVVIDDVGKLSEVVGQPLKIRDKLELTQPMSKQVAESLNIPAYVQRSRPWRWAHEMQKTGNPYRPGTKSYVIYQTISHEKTSIADLVCKLYSLNSEVCEKMSVLLTIYEVLTQCIAAGLLVMDEQTGMVQVCQGPPQPHKMP